MRGKTVAEVLPYRPQPAEPETVEAATEVEETAS
jgi:hypothetical protein